MRSREMIVGVATSFALSCTSARADDVVDSAMFRDPFVAVAKTEPTFDAGLLELWLAALARPEAEMRASAASAIASAHARGMKGLTGSTDVLKKMLDAPDPHPLVRVAVANALVELNARDAADSLLATADASAELREAIYPALAKWDHGPARKVWRDRLDTPAPHQRGHLLAIRSLGAVRDRDAVTRLRELLFADDIAPSLRLEIARALAAIRSDGLEVDAKQCTDPLVAVSLLRNHGSVDAVTLLVAFAKRGESSVAEVAMTRLLEIDPNAVLPALGDVFKNGDAETRRLGVETMLRLPAPDHIPTLAKSLSDPHPEVRNHARRALFVYDGLPTLRPAVRNHATQTLNGPDWRGQEQAALLSGQLKFTPVSPRLVELLTAKRPEVFLAAAWALRSLAVPDTLPAALEHVKMRHKQLLGSGNVAPLEAGTIEEIDRQMSQLVQFLGQAKFAPADPTLRALFPRFPGDGTAPKHDPYGPAPRFSPVGGETRAAAIWSLGHLYSGRSDAKLAKTILDRLTGDPGLGPDDVRVRRMVAIALARMKATETLPTLIAYSDGEKPTVDAVANVCRWAVSQFMGTPPLPPGFVGVPQKDWFLVPRQ